MSDKSNVGGILAYAGILLVILGAGPGFAGALLVRSAPTWADTIAEQAAIGTSVPVGIALAFLGIVITAVGYSYEPAGSSPPKDTPQGADR